VKRPENAPGNPASKRGAYLTNRRPCPSPNILSALQRNREALRGGYKTEEETVSLILSCSNPIVWVKT